MNFNQLRKLAGLKEVFAMPGSEETDLTPNFEDPNTTTDPMNSDPGVGAEMGAEPIAPTPEIPMDTPGMGTPGMDMSSETTIPDLTDVAPTTGTNPPSELVLVLLNKQLSQYLSAMGINIEQSDAGSKALVPVDAKDTYTSAFSDMGYDDTDYRFEEEADLDNGYSDVRQQDDLGKHGDRWFPDGETSTPRNQARMGPSGSARSGSNPMNYDAMHENLTKAYEKFKLEESQKKTFQK